MKKIEIGLLAIAIVMIITAKAFAYHFKQTDWNCVSNCTSQGNMWSYCKSLCSY